MNEGWCGSRNFSTFLPNEGGGIFDGLELQCKPKSAKSAKASPFLQASPSNQFSFTTAIISPKCSYVVGSNPDSRLLARNRSIGNDCGGCAYREYYNIVSKRA